jgi:hypothetical protein
MRTNYGYILLFVLLFFSRFELYAQEEKYIGLFVYNFTKYFDWPESMKSGDFMIEVIGHRSVYDELIKITSGKKVGNQNVVVRNFNSPEGIGNCHILFLGHWHSRYLQDVLNITKDSPTLVITEMEGLLDKGAGINFVVRDGTIKFEMNSTNVQKNHLKTDPRLRELAYRVVD